MEQADSGLGLEAQEAKIRVEAQRRGLPVVAVLVDAGVSGKATERPQLTEALGLLKAGKASMLVVAKVDRLGRMGVPRSAIHPWRRASTPLVSIGQVARPWLCLYVERRDVPNHKCTYQNRVRIGGQAFRVLFSNEGKRGQILLELEAFEKKTQRTHPRTIALAEARLADWRSRARPLSTC